MQHVVGEASAEARELFTGCHNHQAFGTVAACGIHLSLSLSRSRHFDTSTTVGWHHHKRKPLLAPLQRTDSRLVEAREAVTDYEASPIDSVYENWLCTIHIIWSDACSDN